MFENIEGLSAYVEAESALGRIRGNRKLYKTLLLSFLKDPGVQPLIDAVNAGDIEASSALAHKIKGVAANLSLVALHRAVVDIESGLKTGVLSTAAQLEKLNGVYITTENYLQELMGVL